MLRRFRCLILSVLLTSCTAVKTPDHQLHILQKAESTCDEDHGLFKLKELRNNVYRIYCNNRTEYLEFIYDTHIDRRY